MNKEVATLKFSQDLLQNTLNDDAKITFYTGFPSFAVLKACYKFLGLAVNNLIHWNGKNTSLGVKGSGHS